MIRLALVIQVFAVQGAGAAREKRALAARLAQRALREAYRHGLGVEDLMDAIRRAEPGSASKASGAKGEKR